MTLVEPRESGRVLAIVGMQYGSEGKGHVAQLLSSLCQLAVRTGGPNAGHTIHHRGTTFKMRQIPCAFVNPACILAIGPGGLINPAVLDAELKILADAGFSVAGRLYVHENVGVIDDEQIEEERSSGLRDRLGSTLEGVGTATAARALRTLPTAKDVRSHLPAEVSVLDSASYLDLVHSLYSGGATVMLEGTQGAGLSLYHGPYPYVTSRDVSTASLAGASGIHPRMVSDVVGVVRTYPIRVAGNSGPLPFETTYESIGVSRELTTVTGKVRRIAHFDPVAFRYATLLNGPTTLALTFVDYLPPTDRGAWRLQAEALSGVPVDYMGVLDVTASWKRPGGLFEAAARRWDDLGGLAAESAAPPAGSEGGANGHPVAVSTGACQANLRAR